MFLLYTIFLYCIEPLQKINPLHGHLIVESPSRPTLTKKIMYSWLSFQSDPHCMSGWPALTAGHLRYKFERQCMLQLGKNNFYPKIQSSLFLPYLSNWKTEKILKRGTRLLGPGFKIGLNENWTKFSEIQENICLW